MRVILYSRVSTSEQAESGLSMEAQARKLKAYAGLHELHVVAIIEDAGESAKSLSRPGIQRAMAMMRNGEADGIVIAKLDRLTRSIRDLQALLDEFFAGDRGKTLHSVQDSIDTSSATGRMVISFLALISQWERETCAERTSEALRAKALRGERLGAPRFGYAVDDGQLAEDVEQLSAVDLIKQLRTGGMTYRAIAGELTARGIRTKRGNPIWQPTSVRSICKRGRYEPGHC